MGPMAQDFYQAFGLGQSDTTITTTDIDGVNMVALKALATKSRELDRKIEELEGTQADLDELRSERDELLLRLESLEAMVNTLLDAEETSVTNTASTEK
jgi:hypothetical protein